MPGGSSGSGFSSGPSVNNANKDCPAPDRNNKYDATKGKQWQEWDNTLKTFRTITNLYGKSCPTTVPDVSGTVPGKCHAQDDCKYAGDVKKPEIPAGDTTGAGGTPNQTGENAPWKPVEQKTPEQIDNAFKNGTEEFQTIPGTANAPDTSGGDINNMLSQQYGITPENSLGGYGYSGFQPGQSILEQTLNPVSSFNSDYLGMSNTSSMFPQSSGAPQGLESLNAGNGYYPGTPYSPSVAPTTGFNPLSTQGLALNPSSGPVTPFPTAGNTVAPIPFAPSASDPWAIQMPTSPTIPTALAPLLGNEIANAGVFTPPISTSWTAPANGSLANTPLLYPYNAANQIAANFAPGQVGQEPASLQTAPENPNSITAQDIVNATGQPVVFETGATVKSVIPIAADLSGDWVSKGEGQSNFGTVVSGANDWWVNGSSACTNIACAVNIDAESPYVAFGPTPERLAEDASAPPVDANGNAITATPPLIAESVSPGSLPARPATGFAENAALDNPNKSDASTEIDWSKISTKELPKGPEETLSKEPPRDIQGEMKPDASKEREGVISVKAIGETKFDVTAYLPCPSASACPMQGGRESARPGLDGERLVRTLDNYRRGESEYVTGASDLTKRMGQTYEIPSITYRSAIDGKQYTLENVPVYIHDTGSDFVGRPDKLDIATGFANSDAEAMRLASNQPFLNERYQTYTQYSGLPDSGNAEITQTRPVDNVGGSNDLPYSARPAGSYIDQQPLQNASYYGGDVVDTSTKMNGGWTGTNSPYDMYGESSGNLAVAEQGFQNQAINAFGGGWENGAALSTGQNQTLAENAAVNSFAGGWEGGAAVSSGQNQIMTDNAAFNAFANGWEGNTAMSAQENASIAAQQAFNTIDSKDWPEPNIVGNLALEYPSNDALRTDVAPAPTVSIPGETKISDVPPSGTDTPVDEVRLPPPRPEITVTDVRLPPERPLSIPAAESGGGKTADIIAANAGSDNRLQPIQETVPLPPARPEGAPTAASVQEAAQQPPLERLANPDAKPWNSIEENRGNPYDSGGQKLVALGCQGGGGVCGADSRSSAAGGTPLAGDMQGIAVPRDNPQGLKIGDKVNVQVGDRTVENVPVTDYTRSGSNNYVASGGLEKELGGTGRDAALITPSAPEVPLPTPRPQDIDGNGNPIEQAASTFAPEKETEKVIPIEERIPVPLWDPKIFTAESGKDIEAQVKEATSPQDLAVGAYNQAPPDSLNPAIPTETIIPDKNLAYLDDAAPKDLLVSHEQVATDIVNDQAARTFGDEVANVEAPEAKEPDLSVADLSYLNQFEPKDLLLSDKQITENVANDQAARSFASETAGEGASSQVAADSAPAKETTAATAIGEGEAIPLPQPRPEVTEAKKQEAVGNAHAALQDVRDNTDQLEKVLKNPDSTLSSFKSAGNDVLESLKDSRPVLQEAKQAALDAGDKKLADKIQSSIDQVNTSIARINTARNQVQTGINEALNDPTRGWVGRAYIENVAMERLRSSPKLEAGLARLRGIWIRR